MVRFSHRPDYTTSLLLPMPIKAFKPVYPRAIFPDDSDVPFRDAIHHKYVIEILKQVIPFIIVRETRWRRFHFATGSSLIYGFVNLKKYRIFRAFDL